MFASAGNAIVSAGSDCGSMTLTSGNTYARPPSKSAVAYGTGRQAGCADTSTTPCSPGVKTFSPGARIGQSIVTSCPARGPAP